MNKQSNTRGSVSLALIIGVVAITAGVVGFMALQPSTEVPTTATESNTPNTDSMMETQEGATAMEDTADTMSESDVSLDSEVSAPPTAEPLTSGIYTEYNEDLLTNAETGNVVLFFHASWCPSCRSLDKSILENLGDLPSNTTILQVDYDSATELRRQYGVTRQHTLVQVNQTGDEIKKLTGLTNTLDQVLAQL
jgi:thioredoxin 1